MEHLYTRTSYDILRKDSIDAGDSTLIVTYICKYYHI